MKKLFPYFIIIGLQLFVSCSASPKDIILFPISIDKKYGFIDQNGNIIIKTQFDAVRELSEGLIPVKKGSKWGYCNTLGEIIIPIQYTQAYAFRDGLGRVYLGKNGWNYINSKGEFLSPKNFYTATQFYSNYALVGNYMGDIQKKAKHAIINCEGKLITDFSYVIGPLTGGKSSPETKSYQPLGFRENRLIVYINGNSKVNFINTRGNFINSQKYDFVENFQSGIAKVKINEKYGLIDLNGKYITDLIFDDIGVINSELISFKQNNKYGFIDRNGKIQIQAIFDYAESFHLSTGLVGKIKNNKIYYGYINPFSKIIIPIIFEKAFTFDNGGYAIVSQENKTGIINKKGEYVFLPKTNIDFGMIRPYILEGNLQYPNYIYDGIIRYRDKEIKKSGLMTVEGKKLTKIVFDSIYPINNDIFKITIGKDSHISETGYINTNGLYIWEPSQ